MSANSVIVSQSKLARILDESGDIAQSEFVLGTAIHYGLSESSVEQLTTTHANSAIEEFLQQAGELSGRIDKPTRRSLLERIGRRVGTSVDACGDDWGSTLGGIVRDTGKNVARESVLAALNRDAEGLRITLDTTLSECALKVGSFPHSIFSEFGISVAGSSLIKVKTVRELIDLMVENAQS